MNKIPDSFKIAGITFKVDKVDNITSDIDVEISGECDENGEMQYN